MKLRTRFGFGRRKSPAEEEDMVPEGTPRRAVRPKPAKSPGRSTDIVIAGFGVALGLVCAMLPWYVFLNQEEFGIRALVFEGNGSDELPARLAYQHAAIRAPFAANDIPRMGFDFLPTGTLPKGPQKLGASLEDQPFPADLVAFKLVHVANGRAMIQDDNGLWVVQPGSELPDSSRVASIEQRDGSWVLVTTFDRVIPLQE